MEWTSFASTFAILLGIASTIIGLVNSKSKNDKADARQLADLELKMESKVDKVAFAELSVKIDNLTKMVDKINQDMHSVLNDSNTNSSSIRVDEQRISALEARMKEVEKAVYYKKSQEE